MRTLKSFAVSTLAGAATAATLLFSSAAAAGPTQLGFILDRSGSIGSGNWSIIVNGLANAVNTLLPANGTYEVSVVTFASSATANIQNFLVTDVASRTALANQIAGLTFSGGGTNFSAAFSTMNTVLGNTIQNADKSYINFATDGISSTDGKPARDAAIAMGVDNISIEGIGGGVDKTYLMNNICYPGPCDDTSPYNFPNQGFYIGVADAQAYAAAIGNKLRTVTGQIPEPATLALTSLALLGIGALRRKQ
ncbi:hypothetical protein HNQ51_001581 [Inhella inkyongensis]|uniref:VWFA domain-containing protein n=1 Tax=Inhella inkyongensis TaxID=392593 RepID=A0A840RZP8_9BURK|nr:vWA domain-containing protein [Inhella inkyongensis]MBB5204267.1 hypothetical protein [Inhella inkyongensis]